MPIIFGVSAETVNFLKNTTSFQKAMVDIEQEPQAHLYFPPHRRKLMCLFQFLYNSCYPQRTLSRKRFQFDLGNVELEAKKT